MADALTGRELQLLELRRRGASDVAVRRALKVTQAEAHAIANSIRSKLGLPMGASLRDAARVLAKASSAKASIAMSAARDAKTIHAMADSLAPALRRQFLQAVVKLRGRMSLEHIMRAIDQGGMSIQLETALAAWPDDLRPALATVNQVFARAAEQTETALVRQMRLGPFTVSNPRAAAAAQAHGARLVTGLVGESGAAIRQAIASVVGFTTQQGGGTRGAARMIRSLVGLNERQAMAVVNYRRNLLEAGQSPAAVTKATDRYAAKLHRQRAHTIARTETIRASSAGRQATWEDAIAEGYLSPDARKRWVVSSDDLTCDVCLAMEGEIVGMTEAFTGGVQEPPRHPNCRCTTVLVLPKRNRSAA